MSAVKHAIRDCSKHMVLVLTSRTMRNTARAYELNYCGRRIVEELVSQRYVMTVMGGEDMR